MNANQSMIFARKRSQGLSLIELMVAMVLSLFLTLGIIQIFQSNKHTYRAQAGLSAVQESGRFALSFLMDDIRAAGFTGCGNLKDKEINLNGTGVLFSNDVVVDGFENGAGWTNGTGIQRVANTDVVTVTGIVQRRVPLAESMDNESSNIIVEVPSSAALDINNGDLLYISDCKYMDVFQVSTAPTEQADTPATGTTRYTIDPATVSRPYQETDDLLFGGAAQITYFIGVADNSEPCSIGDPANPADDNVCSLYRIDPDGTAQPLVDGVTNMQIVYGVDTDNDRVVNNYVTADNVASWDQVLSMRIGFLAESLYNARPTTEQMSITYTLADTTITYDEPNNSYTFTDSSGTSTTALNADLERKMRHAFNTTVTVRNRVQ